MRWSKKSRCSLVPALGNIARAQFVRGGTEKCPNRSPCKISTPHLFRIIVIYVISLGRTFRNGQEKATICYYLLLPFIFLPVTVSETDQWSEWLYLSLRYYSYQLICLGMSVKIFKKKCKTRNNALKYQRIDTHGSRTGLRERCVVYNT